MIWYIELNRIDIIPAIISKYPPNSAQIMAFLAVADLIRSPLPLAGKSTAHLIFALFDLDQAMILTPNGQLEILQRVAENRAEIFPRFDPFWPTMLLLESSITNVSTMISTSVTFRMVRSASPSRNLRKSTQKSTTTGASPTINPQMAGYLQMLDPSDVKLSNFGVHVYTCIILSHASQERLIFSVSYDIQASIMYGNHINVP